MRSTWQAEAKLELLNARKAAREHLDGRSRVCTRRAAGLAVKDYFRVHDKDYPRLNYYELLLEFARLPELPENIRLIAEHLCRRVDQNHQLAGDIDLVTETEGLIRYVIDQVENGSK
jgi:hypothetical protein